jgi:hypothetical protein
VNSLPGFSFLGSVFYRRPASASGGEPFVAGQNTHIVCCRLRSLEERRKNAMLRIVAKVLSVGFRV